METFSEIKQLIKTDVSHFPICKVALLGDTATQFLSTAIKGLGAKRGFNINLFEGDYNQIESLTMFADSDLYKFDPEYVVIFQSSHKLLCKYNELQTDEDRENLAENRLTFIKEICVKIKCRIIYYNYPEIDEAVFGNYSNHVKSSFVYQVRKLNFELMNLTKNISNLFICDILSIQNKIGRDVMFSTSMYATSDMVLSLDAVPYVATRTVDIVCAVQGKQKKCLILDLDNTLWGGVIGDDGIENIQIGHDIGVGKIYYEFQQWIKKLKNRGIILAVCSKNDENVAKEPFLRHPEMVLKLEDISIFIANWKNKADNIRYIQSVLNIGFDSMVFLDDNPFERELVQTTFPEIIVPDLPKSPDEYLEYLYALNLFETVSYSKLDAERTKQYREEAGRVKAQQEFTNIDDYLKSLQMCCEIMPLNKFTIPRVAQLSQRSNQFNLRTIRYTDSDLLKMGEDEKFVTFVFALEDKFGNNGIIGAIILEQQLKEVLFVNTWFMSCRVLKRGMEQFMMNIIVDYADKHNCKKILGEYIPTVKNKMVAELFPSFGFSKIDDAKNNFVLEVNKYKPFTTYIKIKKK